MIEQHYKTGELAKLLSISPDTLRRAVEVGDLHPSRVGNDFIYDERDVQAWLDRTRVDNSRVVHLRREDRTSTTSRRRSA